MIATPASGYTAIKPEQKKPGLFESEPELLPLRRAAEITHVSTKTLRRLISSGKLPGCRIGKNYLIPRDKLIEYVFGGGGL